MLTQIAKFQRMDYMEQGFTHLGYSSGISEPLHTKSHEQLCRELDKLINSFETLNLYPLFDRSIVTYSPNRMTDTQGKVYDRRGKTYIYKNVLIHLHEQGHTASIVLVNTEKGNETAQEPLDTIDTVGEELFGDYAQKIVEHEKIQQRIVDFLTDMDARLMTAKQVGKAVGISTKKASRYLDELVEKEVIESFEGKKKRKYAK